MSFVTRANTQDSVSQLSGIIATSPCIRLTKPPAGVARWLGSRVRAILPNQNIPASVEAKVRLSSLCHLGWGAPPETPYTSFSTFLTTQKW